MTQPLAMSVSRLQQTAHILSRAERCLTRLIVDAFGDVSVEQWRALVLLGDGAGHPMSEIAQFAMLPAASVTRLIDRMVNDSLVHRMADPADRRRVLVHIAPRGERLRRQLAARLEDIQGAVLAEDADHLVVLLTKFVDRIEQADGGRGNGRRPQRSP